MTIRVITPPTIEPVTLAEAKSQCRVDVTDDDALITGYITTARMWCEKYDWRVYLTQTIESWYDYGFSRISGHRFDPRNQRDSETVFNFPNNEFYLPCPPLASVTSIKYYDLADVEYTLDPTVYQVDTVSTPGRVALRYGQVWPALNLRAINAVVVRFVAGWATADAVPKNIKQAILLLVGDWYENRESTMVSSKSKSIEFGVKALLEIDRANAYR